MTEHVLFLEHLPAAGSSTVSSSPCSASPAGYYAWRQRGPSRRALGDAELASLIRRVFVESLETYGAPRVHAELREGHGVRVGRKRVARLMRQLELEGVSRRGKRRRTTIPDPAAAPAPDLVGGRFTASRPNELWLADITYLPSREGWLFLAIVLDAFSRRIVGWSMRQRRGRRCSCTEARESLRAHRWQGSPKPRRPESV